MPHPMYSMPTFNWVFECHQTATEILTLPSRYKKAESNLLADEKQWIQLVSYLNYISILGLCVWLFIYFIRFSNNFPCLLLLYSSKVHFIFDLGSKFDIIRSAATLSLKFACPKRSSSTNTHFKLHLKPINIRWIRTGSYTYLKIINIMAKKLVLFFILTSWKAVYNTMR